MDQRDFPRQQLVEAEPENRVRLAAADLHDVPRAGHRGSDGPGQATHGVNVAIFVEEFQRGGGEGMRDLELGARDWGFEI